MIINKQVLDSILENINGQVKEKYILYGVNGGYSLFVKLESGGVSEGAFGTSLCLTKKEMYYYLRGLQKAIGSIRWSGTAKVLKRKC